MAMTMAEKILASHAGLERVAPGEIVTAKVDWVILIDAGFRDDVGEIQRVWNKDKIIIVLDHGVPAPSTVFAEAQKKARKFANKFRIGNFFDVGRGGISHQVLAEQGFLRPGELVAMGDSHACTSGALNCASRGLGNPEVVYATCEGETWYKVGETIRFQISGKMPKRVMSKDVMLHIAGTYGTDVAVGKNVEFTGPTVDDWTVSSRITATNMSAELSAEFVLFEADQKLLDYLRDRTPSPVAPVKSDPGVEYAETLRIDVSQLEPQVAFPHSPGNVKPVSEVGDIPIDQAFIGSCANGRIEDLEVAAEFLRGRKVDTNVRLIITPASQNILKEAVDRGLVKCFLDAGALVTNSTCGACVGAHMGLLASGERGITTTNRNYQGRCGSSESSLYLASPATVAASAVAGHISDPRGMR